MEKQRCPYCLNLSDQNICPYCGEEREIAAAENTRAHARNIGNILAGRYQIGKALSHNGEGITYLAYDNQENTRVEIREYFPGNLCARQPDGSVLVGDETLLAFKSLMFDFTDMYKAVAEAGSPGLQKVREIFLEQGTAYAVCELYDLPTLAQYVRENGALSVMEAKRIMLELCSALTPIHRGGLIHGGISPRNILVDEESRIRITGFSTLSLRTRGSGIECELYPGFSAPEQYEANRWQGSWTDVYGIGAVAYHMLTGRYLPPAGERQTGAPLPGLRELPGLPGNMAATIEKALCPESEHRIQSIEEFSAGILQSQQGNTSVFSIKANETLILDEQTRVLGKAVRSDSEKTMVVPEKPKTSAKKKPARSWSRKKLALAVLIFLVGCGGAAVGVSALIGTPIHLPSFSKPQVIDFPEPHYVPSLVGRYVDTITTNSEWSDLFRFSVKYVYDDTIPEGIVISQAPDAGVKMINKGYVLLTVSRGPQNVKMPGLVGSNLDFALKTLGDMGIRYELVEMEEYAPGIVGKTSVVEGQTIDKTKDTVQIYVGVEPSETDEETED